MQTQICDAKSKFGHEIIIEKQNQGLKEEKDSFIKIVLWRNLILLSHIESLKKCFPEHRYSVSSPKPVTNFFFFFFLFLILGDPGVGQPAPPLPGRTLRGGGGGRESSERGWAVRLRAVLAAPPPLPEYLSLEPPGRERATFDRMAGGGAGRACAGVRGAGAECARRSAGLAPRGARGGRGRPRWAGQGRACAHARAQGGVPGASGGGASGGAAGGEGATAAASTFCPNSPPAGRRPPAQGPRACTVPARTSRGRPRRSLAPRRR